MPEIVQEIEKQACNPVTQIIPPPLSLYIHFPWCVKKCPYCDFNSHKLKGRLDESRYIDALIKDLEQDVPMVWGRTVHSVFMGGGTPSLFSAQSIERILNAVRALLQCKPGMEVTMEINPGTGEYDNFVGYKKAGVNRLSIGIQSLKDENLQALGRIHSSVQAIEVYHKARAAGFNNINLDMMFALPDQSIEDARADLLALMALKPNHISYYQLTIEANTLFAVKTPENIPNNDQLEEMYLQGNTLLQSNGYQQYEVSAYARDAQKCQHNVNYWQFGDYLGIGAGAHSKISFGATNDIKRYVKFKHPEVYQRAASGYIQETKLLQASDLLFEYTLNAVRLKQVIKLQDFTMRTGIDSSVLIGKLDCALNMKWVQYQQDTIELTEKGYLLSDEIVKLLL
ncbi:MAG: radical SAM family heme chaperone HemW [Alcanivoracaceae bacterium]|nr:radical SAM family heme chaperone HemW [Alcanivoracaceae bacterium]